MRAVDTNVLVRLVTRDDPHQVAAAEAFVANGTFVPCLVLAESVSVLTSTYELDGARAARAMAMLLEHDRLVLENAEAFAAALGFSDCLALELARNAGHLPLGTFDRDFGKLDGVQRL
jgi:predicted nucleic acid-binding protein